MLGLGMNLITTIIGFAMSATFIVFVCTRLICGRIRRMESRQMFQVNSTIDLEVPENRNTGLEPVVIAAIPSIKFHREAFSSSEDAQCTICLEEYQEKEVLRMMPKCGHSFHLSCIDEWLRKQSTCPVCRLSLRTSYETKHLRPMMTGMRQTTDRNEVPIEQSLQLQLSPDEHLEGNENNQVPAESVFVVLQSTISQSGEAEIR